MYNIIVMFVKRQTRLYNNNTIQIRTCVLKILTSLSINLLLRCFSLQRQSAKMYINAYCEINLFSLNTHNLNKSFRKINRIKEDHSYENESHTYPRNIYAYLVTLS